MELKEQLRLLHATDLSDVFISKRVKANELVDLTLDDLKKLHIRHRVAKNKYTLYFSIRTSLAIVMLCLTLPKHSFTYTLLTFCK